MLHPAPSVYNLFRCQTSEPVLPLYVIFHMLDMCVVNMGYKYTDGQCVLFIEVFLHQIWLSWSENRVFSGPRPRMEGTPPGECTGSLLWERPVIVDITLKKAVITTFPHTYIHTTHTHHRPRDQRLSRMVLSWAPRERDNRGYQQTHTKPCPMDLPVLLLGQNLQVSLAGPWICLLATGFQAMWVKIYDNCDEWQ